MKKNMERLIKSSFRFSLSAVWSLLPKAPFGYYLIWNKTMCLIVLIRLHEIKLDVPWLIVLGFNDTSTLVGHFMSSPREKEKRDRRDNSRDEREEQGKWKWINRRNKNISPLPPPPPHAPSTLTCYKDSRPCPTVSQYQLDALVT